MEKVAEFVVSSKENDKLEPLVIDIDSHSLKRELAREIGRLYKDQNIFSEFKKDSKRFVVKRWR